MNMAKSRQVLSAAGEPIQVVADKDWVDAVGATTNSLKQWAGMKSMMVRALWEHGEFTNPSGRTAGEVMDWLGEHFPDEPLPGQNNVMGLWNNPVNYPAITANKQGKRTYSLKLTAIPETWHRKLMQDIAASPSMNGDRAAAETVAALVMPQGGPVSPVDTSEPDAPELVIPAGEWTDADWANIQLDAPTVFEEPPPLELHIANQVALSLLTTVVEIISSGTADTAKLSGAQRLTRELEQSQHLLSQRLMENDKLRRQIREAGDQISALKMERDGLRSRLKMTEHNLTEVLKGETAQAVNTEIQKRVDQFMRQAPTVKGPDDA